MDTAELQNKALSNQTLQSVGEVAKIGVSQRTLVESNLQLSQFLVGIDPEIFKEDSKTYGIGKDLKTTILSGDAPNINVLRRKVSFAYYLHSLKDNFPLPLLKAAYAQEILFDATAPNSLGGRLNKLIYSIRVMFGSADKESDKMFK